MSDRAGEALAEAVDAILKAYKSFSAFTGTCYKRFRTYSQAEAFTGTGIHSAVVLATERVVVLKAVYILS